MAKKHAKHQPTETAKEQLRRLWLANETGDFSGVTQKDVDDLDRFVGAVERFADARQASPRKPPG